MFLFVAKKNIEQKVAEEKIIALVSEATSGMCVPGETPLVKFSGFCSTGAKGNVYLFASFQQFPSTVANAATRVLIGADFLVQDRAEFELQ